MKKNIVVLIFSLMTGAVIFSVFRYIAVFQAKTRLEQELSRAKKHAGILEGQLRQDKALIGSLSEEKRSLADALKEREARISQLELKNTQNREQIFSLVSEIEDTRKQRDKTMQDLSLSQDKLKGLETKLQSIPELKKAIRELKIQMRKPHPRAKPRFALPAQISEAENNFGYLVRDGASTYEPWVKIEVKPAQ